MSTPEVELLARCLSRCDLELKSYSGRSMYGRECVAFISPQKWGDACLGVIAEAIGRETKANLSALVELFRYARADSMGMGSVLYWPEIGAEGLAEAAQ